VWADDEADLILATACDAAEAKAMAQRRATGEPIEVVVGWAAFCGLRIEVTPGVFVPRRRTEFLARRAAALARPGAVVVDMCCGTGAIAAVVADSLRTGQCQLWACDVDPAAVAVARRNLAAYDATVVRADLFAGLPPRLRGSIDVLVANVPYVPRDEVATLPAEARDHEPRHALDGGADGLDVLRRLARAAGDWLAAGGVMLTEVSQAQVPHALALFEACRMGAETWTSDTEEAWVVLARRER